MRRLSKPALSLSLAAICLVIVLIPYAGYVGLGPPAAAGVVLARRTLREGDRRWVVYLALVVNGLWLALAAIFAWAIAATLFGWPGRF